MRDGRHIILQIYGADFDALRNIRLAEKFLTQTVLATESRPLDEPWVYDIKTELEAQGEEPDPREPEGVTGIVVLSTSHVAIHTWPHRGYAVADAYSCRDFDPSVVLKVVERIYPHQRLKVTDVSHALEMPELPEDT